jgi:hypothetical protein
MCTCIWAYLTLHSKGRLMLLQNYKSSNNAMVRRTRDAYILSKDHCLADYPYILMCYPSHVFHIRIQGTRICIIFVIFRKLVSNYCMQPGRRMKAATQSRSLDLVWEACCHDQVNWLVPSKRSPLESGNLSHIFLYIYAVLNISSAQHHFVGIISTTLCDKIHSWGLYIAMKNRFTRQEISRE